MNIDSEQDNDIWYHISHLDGRELDSAIVEHVFGVTSPSDSNHRGCEWCGDAQHGMWVSKPFHHDWRATGDLIAQMNYLSSTKGCFRFSHGASGYYFASFSGPTAQGETGPQAIARAALLTILIGRWSAYE